MSITKAQLLEKCKPRITWFELDGEKLGIQDRPMILAAKREISYRNAVGDILPDEQVKAGAHQIIDQLVNENGEPVFVESDVNDLLQMSESRLAPIFQAIAEHGSGDSAKNGQAG